MGVPYMAAGWLAMKHEYIDLHQLEEPSDSGWLLRKPAVRSGTIPLKSTVKKSDHVWKKIDPKKSNEPHLSKCWEGFVTNLYHMFFFVVENMQKKWEDFENNCSWKKFQRCHGRKVRTPLLPGEKTHPSSFRHIEYHHLTYARHPGENLLRFGDFRYGFLGVQSYLLRRCLDV